jgi:hypothetical protein
MNVNLHIERLVLDGLAVGSGEVALLQMAVESELGRLLTRERFAPAESSALACVGGGEIGRSVFASLTPYGFGQRGQVKRVPGLSASVRAFENQ